MRKFLLVAALLALPASVRAEGGANEVSIDNFTFAPAKLTVAKGTEVTWTNHDDIPHTIVMTGSGVRSKTLDTDKSFSYTFDKAGNFAYICGLHPHMKGSVVVK